MKEKKKIILSVISLILLVVLVVGITYAAFTYTKKGMLENTVRTGKITFEYTEGENGITLNNAYPVADSVGKVMSDENQMFDFTVDINLYGNKLPVSYEITGEKDVNSTLANEDIRIYLEKSTSRTNYTSILEPSSYIPLTSDDEFGAKTGEMVLEKGSTNESVTFNYRLRMWVGESYKVTGEEKYFTMKVNVYGNDGVTVEVKGVELDKTSETLKLTDTLQLNAKTLPASPTDTSITWTSSNPKIASVSSTGLVEAKGIGTTTITATSTNGKSATASIKVEANNKNITATTVYNETTCPTGKEDTCEVTTCLADGNCPAGTNVSYKVNDTTTQDFHVLKDNGTTLTLITINNIVESTRWSTTNKNDTNADAAKNALSATTSEWNTTARMITREEAESVGCKVYQSDGSTDFSCPQWLFEPATHWIDSLAVGGDDCALVVGAKRTLYPIDVTLNYYGARAVIIVSK